MVGLGEGAQTETREFKEKGTGIITKTPFKKYSYIAKYTGHMITGLEADKRNDIMRTLTLPIFY